MSELSPITLAIHQWIRDDAPVSMKMTITPALVSALSDRIDAARAEGVATPKGGIEMLVSQDWLRRKVETDPDIDAEIAARAEGPAPVSARLDREGFLADLRKWFDRTIPATEAAIDYLNEDGWDDAKALHVRLLALTGQQDQVGLTTPAVLGEPSADALRSGGEG